MTGTEARLARETLGLTPEQLAADTSNTPSAVIAWEEGRIRVPRHIARDLMWHAAVLERQRALAASGLPQCAWIEAFENEPEPNGRSHHSDRVDRALAHARTCEVCAAREAFVAERFPPMPPAPRPGWLAITVPIAERVQSLPRWAQAPATGAILFVAYSLFRLLLLLPSLARSGWPGLLAVIGGFAASATLGAVVGFIYDLYRRWRDARSSPERTAALEILDRQMAELRASGHGGGAAHDAYLRQRRAILRGQLTVADLQSSAESSVPGPPNNR
jgi:transcriptional regulator with XRE-family HTH domain